MIDEWVNDIHQADAAEVLQQMPESSVHMAMCSPPYYGLRDYQVDGQIGLEETLTEYIDALVDVGRELMRVLRPDGSWWLNLGDSFAGSWGAQSKDETSNTLPQHGFPDKNPGRNARLGRKQKMLVPHRTAIALQADGWVLRSDAVWAKPNPMPHPVKDRLREDKEYLFHLTPEPDYWFDLDAIREPHAETSLKRSESSFNSSAIGSLAAPREDARDSVLMDAEDALHPRGKNPGDVLEIPVRAFPEAHFAVYPPALCELPIKSSCPPRVCTGCGTPYNRDVEYTTVRERFAEKELEGGKAAELEASGAVNESPSFSNSHDIPQTPKIEHKGWEPACDCDSDGTEPGIVLDPFAGAGTTLLVAKRLGRRFVGIDLNPEYVAMAQRRVGVDVDEPERLLDDDQPPLRAFADGGLTEAIEDGGSDA